MTMSGTSPGLSGRGGSSANWSTSTEPRVVPISRSGGVRGTPVVSLREDGDASGGNHDAEHETEHDHRHQAAYECRLFRLTWTDSVSL